METANSNMPLISHLAELKNRLLLCILILLINTGICYYFAPQIYQFLLAPLSKILGDDHKLIYTGLAEAFFTYLKLAFYSAIFITIPVILTQVYLFLSPGLYKNERKSLLPFMISAPILFILGAALVYYLVFPMAYKFFLSFEELDGASMPIKLEARVSEYLSLVLHLIFAFGFAFQLPIILTLLAKMELITVESLKEKRRLAIVIIFAVAAIITPPDVFSQIALAVPLILLYEISIIACKLITKKRIQDA